MADLSSDECSETTKMLPINEQEATTLTIHSPLNITNIECSLGSTSMNTNNTVQSKNFVPTFEVNIKNITS